MRTRFAHVPVILLALAGLHAGCAVGADDDLDEDSALLPSSAPGAADMDAASPRALDGGAEAASAADASTEAPDGSAPPSRSEQVTISGVSASGSGCPAGSFATSWAPDGRGLKVIFSHYLLEATPAKPTLQTLACNVSLKLDMPSGYSVGVTKISYSGYAFLDRGVVAEQISNYAWTGVGTLSQNEARSTLTGPYDDDYVFTDNIESRGRGIQWSPCNITSNLQIRTRLILTNNVKGNGYINMGELRLGGGTELTIQFVTKSC